MPNSTRQLAAIMFTDIVGYTAIMGKDSAKAMELVRHSKEIQKPLVEKHKGKWLKEMGDGAMAQFGSALDAVNCALEIQRLSRADFGADLRIGIHLGDITVENDDVYGDGVNVAARLESIADPGGIYVSESIEKAIRGQSDVLAKYLGEIKLKNVDYDVRTYALQGIGLPVPDMKNDKDLSGRFFAELKRRGVVRAGIIYILLSLLLTLLVPHVSNWFTLPDSFSSILVASLIFGFPVAVYLAWRYERSPEGFVRSSSEQSWRNPLDVSERKPLTGNLIMIGLGLMIVFIQIYPAYISSSVSEESTNENKEEDKSIAVLPFDNLSADEENQYFADGQMEAILNHLTRIADLRVISRTTMMGYRGKTKNIPDIARELGVRYVLEGSVQKAGEKVRITAQLIDAESDEHLWSDNYDRDLADIFGIQTEIAKKVVQELKMTISSREQINIESTPTSDLTAYDFYLRGMDFESRGNRKEDLQFALQMYKHAVELDKNYTLAWVSLASTSRSMYWFYRDRSSTRLEKTKEYLDKALELEPDLLEVQIETGRYYYQCQLNYQKALGIFEPLLTSYPKNDQLNFWTGAVYRRKGEFEKAFELMDRAIKLNPSEWDHWQNAAGTLVYRKKYKQAESFYRIAMDLNPLSVSPQLTHLYLNVGEVTKARNFADNNNRKTLGWFRVKANVELFDRNYKKAISILESSSETIESHQSWLIPKSLSLGMIYRLMPDVESAARYFQEAKKMLEELIIEDPEDFRILGSLGIVYAGLGMREEALEAGNKALSIMNLSVDAMKGYRRELELAMIWLMIGEYDQAISKLDFLIQQNGSRSVEYLKLDPFWDPIRDMDAFKALINNPAYQVDWNE